MYARVFWRPLCSRVTLSRLAAMSRKAKIQRKTNETAIDLTLDLDGKGERRIATPVPFFNHMLEAVAKHGLYDLEVTANFKETQLKSMRPGQPVNVHVDAFDRDYTGTVEELPGAAGTLFSLLPPENASGNFVKVVQRLPVRIRLAGDVDQEHRLRPGMSVEARVQIN